MGLEDLEVDQRVDLWRSRTRGFNQMPQHYNRTHEAHDIEDVPFKKIDFRNTSVGYARPLRSESLRTAELCL